MTEMSFSVLRLCPLAFSGMALCQVAVVAVLTGPAKRGEYYHLAMECILVIIHGFS